MSDMVVESPFVPWRPASSDRSAREPARVLTPQNRDIGPRRGSWGAESGMCRSHDPHSSLLRPAACCHRQEDDAPVHPFGRVALLIAICALAVGGAVATVGLGSTSAEPAAASRSTDPSLASVGFRGDASSLQVIDSSSTAPAGSRWAAGYLEVTARDLTLDGVFVRGGVDFLGGGTLTIRNSIVEGGYGSWLMVVARTGGATLDVRDSTLRWREGAANSVGSGALQILASAVRIISVRNDISGTADGIQIAGDGSRVEQTWIHDLAAVGAYPNNTHNDGVQIYNGRDLVIANNRIEIGFDGVHQNAALFFQPGAGNAIPGAQIYGNYLEGGGFTLRLEGATTGTIVRDNVFGPLGTGWGHAHADDGATIAAWESNTTTTSSPVSKPD